RERSAVTLSCPLFMVMGDDEEAIVASTAETKGQIAFYASTPAYRRVLDPIGYGELQPQLQQLSREGKWQKMSGLIDDDLLHHLAFVGRPEDMPALVRERFDGRLDRVSSYFGWPVDDPDRLGEILAGFHTDDD
ncbi:MAG: LLM class flavin-dependent oxidoreductase, partial [Ilumatobacter fluminis]